MDANETQKYTEQEIRKIARCAIDSALERWGEYSNQAKRDAHSNLPNTTDIPEVHAQINQFWDSDLREINHISHCESYDSKKLL